MNIGSQGKNCFWKLPWFQGQIEDLPLKCGTEKGNPKNNISGRKG
jgi:hypothetical protein